MLISDLIIAPMKSQDAQQIFIVERCPQIMTIAGRHSYEVFSVIYFHVFLLWEDTLGWYVVVSCG
jgi:hypothetical protein